MRPLIRALLLVIAALLGARTASAHPHVLIDSHLVFLFEAGRIKAVQMGWKFDPVYSQTLVQDFDDNKDGQISPSEMAAIEAEAFSDTRPLHYLTQAKVDGMVVDWPKAADFKMFAHEGSVVYAFRLDFPAPPDPRIQKVAVAVFEESFYIDIDIPNDAAVKLVGDGAQGCRAAIGEDKAHPLLGGAAFPRRVVIECAG